jgi:hypothetical protein
VSLESVMAERPVTATVEGKPIMASAPYPESMLSPDGIAQTYWNVLQQPRDAWSLEVELRPWVETF